ncbi:MAG: PDZ domain-containing protein [Thermoguttaceae bacterium]|nr:PDZ domain-containing protein [Thermoguttaceae bacterium]
MSTALTGYGAELAQLEEEAFRAAAARVAPAVVRIETLGGLERVGRVLAGTGPTTGLVVGEDGYIVSSAFNFFHRPASILVRLTDGTRKPAQLVATDHSRMIVLLKIEVDEPLAVPEFAPREELRVGQWALALGRVFDGDAPNVAVGIVSAGNRVWGKAVQTDAAVSPNNYGGPLVDIAGRVIGVVAPLSPQGDDEVAGHEWYDSGIGFAVHGDQILRALPRLKAGEDLHPGLLGVNLRGANPAISDAVVANCHPNSPAQKGGLKSGDRIVEINGRPVGRVAELKEELAQFYAGETVRLVVARDDERFERALELVAKLPPYEHPFLGILPMRDPLPDGGVAVRYVYPEGPAARAGIQRGDVLAGREGQAIKDASELRDELAQYEPNGDVGLSAVRDGKTLDVTVKLGRLPEDLPPDELPPAHAGTQPAQGPGAGSSISVKVPEFPNDAWAYLPRTDRPELPRGLVVWLHDAEGLEWDALLAQWKQECDRGQWILLAPKAVDPRRWDRIELSLVRKLIDQMSNEYVIDPARIVLAGRDAGGAMALLVASQNRDVVRGIGLIDAPLPGRIAPNEPLQRLAFFIARSEKSRHAAAMATGVQQLREAKYPVTMKSLGDDSRPLTAEERAEFSRWVDALDRM